jgi:hypothetical protein
MEAVAVAVCWAMADQAVNRIEASNIPKGFFNWFINNPFFRKNESI